MNSKFKVIIVFLVAVNSFSAAACTAPAQTLNSAEALKEYLNKQPANSPDNPIKVTMNANATMLEKIAAAINSTSIYVSLNLSGSALTTIPDDAFYDRDKDIGCVMLTAITIPDSVTSIGQYAFCNCTSLTSINIPSSVTSIGPNAFMNCLSLVTINIDAGNSVYSSDNGILYNKEITILIRCPAKRTGTFSIPDSVTRISDSAFFGCTSLTSITIPGSVTNIEMAAFIVCTSLTSITIPDSVTSIGNQAFDYCTSLTSVTFRSTIDSRNLGSRSFPGDLRAKYLAGGIGTYTRASGSDTWTKQ